jgi:WD40 repeat protein/serine/threonine protein kinase
MSTNTSSADYGQFEVLAEEFAARFRRGERPSLQEYIDRCPELADEIRELFPALVEVERVKDVHPAPPGDAETAAAPPPLGQVGDYRVLREVGRGGMGVVYEAEQVSLGRRVALKVLPRQISQDLKTLARFRREARSAAQLHHTNIVPVFEVGKDGEVSYYAMQFIQGQGLDTVIDELRSLKDRAHPTGPTKEPEPPPTPIPTGSTVDAPPRSRPVSRMADLLLTGRFAPETPGGTSTEATTALTDGGDWRGIGTPPASENPQAASSSPASSAVLPGGSQLSAVESGRRPFFRSVAHIGRQVAAGLAYAHARGIVHRDIKPSNLLLDTEGVVWITDFGLAKAGDDGLTQTGDILGTIRYMAPERFRGEGDGRADVYALGLTLYELLTLRPAFDSSDRLQLIEQIKAEYPPRPRSLDPRIPRDLETIVLKAIDKDPKARYPTADVLAEDLQRFLDDRPIRARRISSAEIFVRWSRRNPVVAGLAAALLVAIVIGTVLSWMQTINANAQAVLALDAEGRALEAEAIAKTESARTRRLLYDADMKLASEVWERDDGSPRTVRDLLDAHVPPTTPEDLRDFSWRYQWNLLHQGSVPFRGHKGKVSAQMASPDLLVTLDSELILRHWDRELARVIRAGKLDALPDINPKAIAWQGHVLALGSKSGAVLLLDTVTGRELRILRAPAFVARVAFSPDGALVATIGSDLRARIWQVASGRETASIRLQEVDQHWKDTVARHAALGVNGKTLVLADHILWNNVSVHDMETGAIRATLPNPGVGYQCVACSPDGRTAAWGDYSGRVGLLDVATGRPIGEPQVTHTDRVYELAFSPDGRYLATGGGDGQVAILDVARRERMLRLKGHLGAITSLAFAGDGKALVSGSQDGSARVWDLTTYGKPWKLAMADENMVDLAYSPDGRWLATGDYSVRLWDPRSGRLVRTFPGPSYEIGLRVAFSPNSRTLATGGHNSRVTLWDVETGREIHRLDGRYSESWDSYAAEKPIGSLAFSPDGTLLAAGFGQPSWLSRSDRRQKIKIWEVASGREARVLEVENHVRSLSFSPDGKRLVAACRDNGVPVWEVASWRETIWPRTQSPSSAGPDAAITAWSVGFSPDGTLLAAGFADGAIVLWETATGSIVRTFGGHASHVIQLAFSPDGRTLASASHDKTAKLWDFRSGRELRTLRGHSLDLTSLAWSPEGDVLATAAEDRSILLWEAASPLEVALERGDTRTFEERHSRDVAAHPGDLPPWTRRALAYARQGRPDEAAADLLRALELASRSRFDRPSDPAAFADEVDAWTRLFPRVIFDSVAREVAREPESVLRSAAAARPHDPRVWLARCRVLTQLGQRAEAEVDLGRALGLTPDGSLHRLEWEELAQFFSEQGRPKMAARARAKAAALTSNSAPLLRSWGVRSAEEGDWAMAAADFGRSFEWDPDDVFTANCWINALRQAGDHDGCCRAASALFAQVGRIKVHGLAVELLMGVAQGPDVATDWERWIAPGHEAVARMPTFPWLHHTLAGVYLRTGKYASALHWLDESDRVGSAWPGRVINDVMRAIVHLRLGSVDTARPLLVQADRWYEGHLKSRPQRPFGDWTGIVGADLWLSFQSLRREAQALMNDVDFPANPFAG